MKDLVRYLDDIVEPTIEEFARNPLSIRHAFLACVATFHAVDYLAYPRASRGLRQEFGNASPDFKLVNHVAHAFKHVVSGNPQKPNLKSDEVVKRGGAFQAGTFDPLAFDVGAVTISDRPAVNLLRTVKQAVQFLRNYRTPTKN
jgi:hypothetical protein